MKRVFNSACDSVFQRCLEATQHAFPGLLPYQLATASDLLHSSLLTHPLIARWLKSPPTRPQVDSATRLALARHQQRLDEEVVLGLDEFVAFAVDLFTDAVVTSVRNAMLSRVPIGVGGIVGVGVLTKSRKDLVGTAVGVYALGVATSVYLSISGSN
uniref:Uncharacterized protein n=1 Tax=Kalanchoe fedtschenkoi TaxID=63787 RepID=A0A7N0ZUD3_KALFE